MSSSAGGFTPEANTRSILLARSQGPGRERVLTLVSIDQYLKTGAAEHNPLVQSGDLVFVHTSSIANAGRFFTNLSRIIAPALDLERGYWIGQNIIVGPGGSGTAA